MGEPCIVWGLWGRKSSVLHGIWGMSRCYPFTTSLVEPRSEIPLSF